MIHTDSVQSAIRELWTQCADAWGLSDQEVARRVGVYVSVCGNSSPGAIRAAIIPALRTFGSPRDISPAKFHALVQQEERHRARVVESRGGARSLCVHCGTTETTNPADPTVRIAVSHYADCPIEQYCHAPKLDDGTDDGAQRVSADEIQAFSQQWRQTIPQPDTPEARAMVLRAAGHNQEGK